MDVSETQANVCLAEYNYANGMILATNTSNRRIKNVKKLLRIGNKDFMQVSAVDEESQYIDLTKKSVKVNEIKE